MRVHPCTPFLTKWEQEMGVGEEKERKGGGGEEREGGRTHNNTSGVHLHSLS
jgi:hypothetical protein